MSNIRRKFKKRAQVRFAPSYAFNLQCGGAKKCLMGKHVSPQKITFCVAPDNDSELIGPVAEQ